MRLRAAAATPLALLLMCALPAVADAGPRGHAVVADFDGDGISDISVLRPDGSWHIAPSGIACCWGFSWGYGAQADIRAVPGDYDGDLATDPADVNLSDGVWQIMPSHGTGAYIVPFGQRGDIPVPADYDGNGSTDIAVYRPAEGVWYVLPSMHADGPNAITFGSATDVPVPGDYDGDRLADLAVFQPSTGIWTIRRSSDGVLASDSFGTGTDTLVPADYDGDGRIDLAVFRPSDATWSIHQSGDGKVEEQIWGRPGDLVAPADYDGDGRTDLAVYHAATGDWLIRGAAGPARFGDPDDVPVAGAYLPGSPTV